VTSCAAAAWDEQRGLAAAVVGAGPGGGSKGVVCPRRPERFGLTGVRGLPVLVLDLADLANLADVVGSGVAGHVLGLSATDGNPDGLSARSG
jgi:hypothetical protein